ncbi:MAG TPA: hypothetical protein VM915_01575 [Verrucomicrobiae bacterium]|nr:hypothetical protein [Verrucomicrobiae bacterium]
MTDAAAPAFQGHGTKGYRAYVLGALLVVYTFNFIDRVVIGIIQEPIKAEFGLSDFELGLLGGPAFAILYTLLGIPIARFAERHNRMTILAICLGVWSAMTAACDGESRRAKFFLRRRRAREEADLLARRVWFSAGELRRLRRRPISDEFHDPHARLLAV